MESELERFFDGTPEFRRLYLEVEKAVRAIGATEIRVGRSQIAFRRRRAFAWAWMPARWLRGKTAPLVLSIALRRKDAAIPWKEVVEPRPGQWMHHLEVWSARDLSDRVLAVLREAWEQAN